MRIDRSFLASVWMYWPGRLVKQCSTKSIVFHRLDIDGLKKEGATRLSFESAIIIDFFSPFETRSHIIGIVWNDRSRVTRLIVRHPRFTNTFLFHDPRGGSEGAFGFVSFLPFYFVHTIHWKIIFNYRWKLNYSLANVSNIYCHLTTRQLKEETSNQSTKRIKLYDIFLKATKAPE